MSRVVYDCKGEWLIEVEPDGRVFTRQRGGPLHHFGGLQNAEVATVSSWRARIPVARHGAMVASFEEAARAMEGCMFPLVPDEHGSTLTCGARALDVVHSSLDAVAALERVVAELGGIARALWAGSPTERLANPERDQWNSLPLGNRRTGPDAPDPLPDAPARAQAAVDHFYAGELDAMLARVASRSRPQPSGRDPIVDPQSPLRDVKKTFTCRATGKPAGEIELRLEFSRQYAVGGALELADFAGMGSVTIQVKQNDLRRVHRWLVEGDALELWKDYEELMPFYCGLCHACFAASEWKIYDTSPTRIEGSCPAGHRRRIRAR